MSWIKRGQIDRAQVDTSRRYIEALGGTLRLEVQIGDKVFQIA